MEEKKIVVYVLHGFWENEFTNGCAVVDVSIDLETVMKKLDEIVENKAREYVKVQEDKAEEERGFRYFEIWDENGQSAKFYIVEQYLELSQSMMEAIAESLAKGAGKCTFTRNHLVSCINSHNHAKQRTCCKVLMAFF